jgi:hypothetical protein
MRSPHIRSVNAPAQLASPTPPRAHGTQAKLRAWWGLNPVQVQVLSPALQAGKGVTATPGALLCCAQNNSSAILLHPLAWHCTGLASAGADGSGPSRTLQRSFMLNQKLPVEMAYTGVQL